MSLHETPSAERTHIGFFGMRNAGKSSLVNAVTGQTVSVVSGIRGTTTDPVRKSMELLPLGPVTIIDTPGLDDTGELGALRVERAKRMLAETDIAVVVIDAAVGPSEDDKALFALLAERKIPCLIAYNKADTIQNRALLDENSIYVSTVTGENINALKERLGSFVKPSEKVIAADLVSPGDTVILVIPVDEAAPKGRLILPQQLTLREMLDHHIMTVCCQPEELPAVFASLAKPPKLVITDSQAFGRVSKDVPDGVLLTSFSILFARYKGDLSALVRGAAELKKLRDGDRVLISEGCTHHRQCADIGTVKLPHWIETFSGAKPDYTFTSGGEYPADLTPYRLIVHCGGCMLNEAEMNHRIETAVRTGVPIVNYGVAIAHIHGILKRSLAPFPEIQKLLETK
ncbi:MAG: [FeFe] hydrogenase H-cluster maturation GTPase HydF [Clostridia bacterium]|nr:[FeFe] hydrogenase H-cluster maturation GTPase HydF [Clostridia bacterium]